MHLTVHTNTVTTTAVNPCSHTHGKHGGSKETAFGNISPFLSPYFFLKCVYVFVCVCVCDSHNIPLLYLIMLVVCLSLSLSLSISACLSLWGYRLTITNSFFPDRVLAWSSKSFGRNEGWERKNKGGHYSRRRETERAIEGGGGYVDQGWGTGVRYPLRDALHTLYNKIDFSCSI